jgi:hypothetical protein
MKEPMAFTDRTYVTIVALVVATLLIVLALLEAGGGPDVAGVLR